MIERISHWQFVLVRRLIKPDRLDFWLERRGLSNRLIVRAVFGLAALVLVVIAVLARIWMYRGSGNVPPVNAPPLVIVRTEVISAGVLLVPLAFFVLFWMRRTARPWIATGLVAFFTVPWLVSDGFCACAQAEMLEVLATIGTLVTLKSLLASGAVALFCLLAFGALDQMALLIDRETKKAKQREQ